MNRYSAKLAGLILAALGMMLVPGRVATAANEQARALADETALAAWADSLFVPALAERRYAGLVVAVVKDGATIFARGYGAADAQRGTPVDPAATLFRIGSATKVFTATAIAQLVEAGKIASLDEPANKYLKRLQLPSGFGKDVTLWHLLTHRAGFEDSAFGLGTSVAPVLPVDGAAVRRRLPAIVREPGTDSVYSNFSTALLGLIVEDVSGMPIAEYFRSQIFAPLGMGQTYLNYDPAPAPQLGRPYAYLPNGELQAIDYVAMDGLIAPAGGISTTAQDMARFMAAQLDEGRSGTSILSADGFARMHTRHVGNHDAVSGFGMKFIVQSWNGERVVEHGGGWPGFETVFVMFPDSNLGVFVSIMGGGPQVGIGESLLNLVSKSARLQPDPARPVKPPLGSAYVREAILTHFFGPWRPDAVASGAAPDSALVGSYWRQRRAYTTSEAVLDLFNAGGAMLQVTQDADGLRIGGAAPYRTIAPGVVWKQDGGPELGGNPAASAVFAFTGAQAVTPLLSVDVWRRADGFWNPASIASAMALLALLSVSSIACLGWPADRRSNRLLRFVPPLQFVLLLGVPLSLLGFYGDGGGLMYPLLRGEPARFVAMILCANLYALLALALAAGAVAAWRNGWWGRGFRAGARRVHLTVLALVALALLPLFHFFHLLGIHLP